MASFSHTYSRTHVEELLDAARSGFGGSRGRPSSAIFDRTEPYTGGGGSHMPIDTSVHWTWCNPLNVLPALVLLATLIAIVGTLFA